MIGYTDLAPRELMGIPYLGNDCAIDNFHNQSVVLINGIGSTGRPLNRCDVYRRHVEKGYDFKSVFQSNAVISSRAVIHMGVQVIGAAVINTGSIIHENCLINTSAIIDHDCTIGPHTHIGPGTVISGNVQIGEGCHIGTGTVIIQGVKIGDNVLIGAGSLIISDIPSGVKAYGSPVKIIY
jgi:UDP-perosamine 4-acetyltransferase